MKFRGTWALLAIALIFGLYIYFVEFKKAAQDAEQKEASEKVLSIDTTKVKSITLKNEHGEFQLELTEPDTWNLKAPVADAADKAAVTGMLKALGDEKFEDSIEPVAADSGTTTPAASPGPSPTADAPASSANPSLKAYGLDQPKESITLVTKDGKTVKVNVGNDAPLPGKTYLQRDGDKKILLAQTGFKTQLSKEQKDLRDKTILRKSRADANKVTITYNSKDNKGLVVLTKGKDGWLLGEGDQAAPADGDVAGSFLTNIDNLKATDFVSEKGDDAKEIKKFGLEKPDMVITFDGDKGHIVTMSFSAKKDNNVYVKTDDKPTIYAGFVSSVDQLYHKYEDFKDRKLPFAFKKEDVTEIVMKTGVTDLDLMKKGSAWELAVADAAKQVNQSQIETFLTRLSALRINEFLDKKEKPQGLNPAEKQIVLKDAKGQTVLSLAWGDKTKSGKNYFAKTDKSPNAFGVDVAAIDGLPGQTMVENKASPAPAASNAKPGTANGTNGGDHAGTGDEKPAPAAAMPEAHKLPQVVDPGAAAPTRGGDGAHP